MSEKQPTENDRKSRPWVSILITVVLLAMAVQSQLKTGSVDHFLLGALVVLVGFWMGKGIDNFPGFK